MKGSDKMEELRRQQLASVGYLLIRCGQLWNERGIARVNAEAGAPVLREAHTRLIPFLMDPEGVRITELAARLKVTKQAVAPLVAELAAQGVVRVEVDPRDARARRVTLTDRGLDAMFHGTGVLRQIEDELVSRLGRGPFTRLRELLTGLLEVLEAEPGPSGVRRESPVRRTGRSRSPGGGSAGGTWRGTRRTPRGTR